MRWVCTVLAVVVAVAVQGSAWPAPALAQEGADVSVSARVVDDRSDPQVVEVVVRNHGPAEATYPTLVVDAGGQAITGHTGDPQPGSTADGVGCQHDDRSLSCQWTAIAVGAEVALRVSVAVEAEAALTAQLSAAGTPDPNPEVGNSARVLLSPAVADLGVTATSTPVEGGVLVEVVVRHDGGRPTAGSLRVEGSADGAPSACAADADGFTCPLAEMAAGEERRLARTVPRPEPDEPPVVLVLRVATAELADPDPDDDVAEVVVGPRDRVPADVRRHEGAERIATAVAIAHHAHPDGAPAAVLARADDPADALAGAPLAAAVGGPILLTPGGQLADGTAAALDALLPPGAAVHLLGGEAALDRRVADAVTARGLRVVRHAGVNRYATSSAIADAIAEAAGAPAEVAVADGDAVHDAVLAAAAMAARGGALVLTSGARVPAESGGWARQATWAVGEPASRAVPSATGLVGTTPAETAVVVAAALFAEPAAVGLATTAAYPDALAGGPLVAAAGGPLLLIERDALPAPVASYLQRTTSITTAHLFGGTGAISDAVESEVRQLLSR